MSRALVTGATTPLGRALIADLLGDPAIEHVLAVGIEAGAHSLLPQALPRLSYRQVDLTRSRGLRELLHGPVRQLEIDTVVHLAFHRQASQRGERAHRLNVESTRELLEICAQHPTVRRFILRGFSEVYDVRGDRPTLIAEGHPLNLSPRMPQWVRDRVEADLTACTQMGMGRLSIAVLRCAECLAPYSGSQLFDYLGSRVCFRPMGYDPMLNLATTEDLARAFALAAARPVQGIFNIPGYDTLPLSRLIRLWRRTEIAVPGPLLTPLYALRRLTIGRDFRYDLNFWRFHFSGVLDGRRAQADLGYTPRHPILWPAGWNDPSTLAA